MTGISDAAFDEAIHALEAQGLPTTHNAVLNWLAQHGQRSVARSAPKPQLTTERRCEAEPHEPEVAAVVPRAAPTTPQNKRGRPPRVASWFSAVAKRMADGTALRMALLLNGIRLDAREIRRLYRLVEFRRLYRLERRMYQLQKWGRIPQDQLDLTRKRLLARIL